MKHLVALTRRELGSLFLVPSLHVVTTLFVLLYGWFFTCVIESEQVATFDSMALFVCFVSLLIVPLITMRAFAEETASGTIELLLTAPVGGMEVVLSKFVGAFTFFLASLLPLVIHAFLLSNCGQLDWGVTLASFLGLAFLGGLLVAIGLFASSLTSSQFVAAAVSCVINLLLLLLASVGGEERGLSTWISRLSFVPYFKKTFILGQIETRSIIYFLSMTACVLFLTWLVVNTRGSLSRLSGGKSRRWSLVAGIAFGFGGVCILLGISWMDIEGVLSWQAMAGNPVNGWSWRLTRILPFAVGVLAIAGAAFAFHRSRGIRSHGSLWILRSDEIAPSLISALAVCLLLININYLAAYPFGTFRHAGLPFRALALLAPHTWDVSENKQNTLHIDTRRTLDELGGGVNITVFYSEHIQYAEGVRLLEETRELLGRYEAYSSLVRVRWVDAESERDRALALGREMELNLRYLNQVAVMSYTDATGRVRRAVVPAGLLLKAPDRAERLRGTARHTFNGELAFTIALKRLMDPRTVRVYFTDGHGEYRMGTTKQEPHSIGRFARALKRESFEVKRMLLKDAPVPHDCDVLILAGPEVPLGQDTAEQLEAYVKQGGRILLLLPQASETTGSVGDLELADPDLKSLITSWGIVPRGDMVFDHVNAYAGQSTNVPGVASSSHPIGRAGRAVKCVFPRPQSLRENLKEHDKGWMIQRLLESSSRAQSHRRTEKGKKTRRGPFALGITASRRFPSTGQEARVVVIGNTEFVSNLWIDLAHNRAMAVATVHWLAGRDYQIRVEKPEFIDRQLHIDAPKQRLIRWVSLLWLPSVWGLVALSVWWARKQ